MLTVPVNNFSVMLERTADMQQLKTLDLKTVKTDNLKSKNLFLTEYRNDPKFSDSLVWANSADPNQTAPRGAV